MRNHTPFEWSLVGICAVLAIAAGTPRDAVAAKSPEAKCRGAVAGAVKALVTTGLKTLDSCHKRRDKSGSPADCNELDGAPSVQGALARGRAKISALCQSDNPVLVNYPDGNVAGINDKLLPAVIAVLEESGRELQGSPTFTGDKATLKALRKCHGAIGKGRTATVGEIFTVSSACQKRLDKNAPAFSSIAPECVANPGRKSAKAIGKLGQSCSGIDGATVGSCASLPECVASAATADGQLLSRLTFGGPTECGNGIVELGEDCDDGNTVDGDACPATCGSGECGNGVREGAEACDDGATTGNEDACLNSCEVASCGDGYVQDGVEECDDAAPPEGAVCTGCQLAAAACGADGLVQATVELEVDESINPGAEPPATLEVQLDYPAIVNMPGSADAPEVVAAVSDLTGVGLITVNDDDAATTVSASYLELDPINPPNIEYGAIFRVQFQGCPNGTPLRPSDFPCTVPQVYDALGLAVEGVTCRVTSLAAAGTPPTTTTSTSSSSTSTVTSGTSGTTSTSTTIVSNDVCGNGMTVPPETCDDGNSDNTDNCPSDCIVDACQATGTPAGTLTVNVDNQGGSTFGALTVFIDYPEGLVLIPGFGDDGQVQQAVTDRPASSQCVVNDRGEHGLQFGCLNTNGLSEGLFFRAAFRDCANGGPPAPSNFTCTVLEAASTVGAPVATTCTLSLQ